MVMKGSVCGVRIISKEFEHLQLPVALLTATAAAAAVAGKGVCAPDVNGLLGLDACLAFKAVCSKVGVVAKTCL